jgi:hypothetical protein
MMMGIGTPSNQSNIERPMFSSWVEFGIRTRRSTQSSKDKFGTRCCDAAKITVEASLLSNPDDDAKRSETRSGINRARSQ